MSSEDMKILHNLFEFLDFWHEFFFKRGIGFWEENKDMINTHYDDTKALKNKIWGLND